MNPGRANIGKWDRNVSLLLAAIMLVGGGVWAYFFVSATPSMGPGTPEENELAEKWIRVLLTVFWVGASVFSVLLIMLISAVIGKAGNILAKGNLGLRKMS